MSKDEKKEMEPTFTEQCFKCMQFGSIETFCYKDLILFKNLCKYLVILKQKDYT